MKCAAPQISIAVSDGRIVIEAAGLLDALAGLIAERLDRIGGADQTYLDQFTAPVSKRQFLEAARRGEFASKKIGKRVLARRTDVEAWLDKHSRAVAVPTDADDVLDAAAARISRRARRSG